MNDKSNHNHKRRRMCQYRGSLTVEAAMILPVIIIVIVTMILFSFYMHDITCVRALLQDYSVTECNSDKTESAIQAELGHKLKDQTLVTEIKDIIVKVKNNKTVIEVEMNFNMGYWNINRSDTVKVTMYSDNTRQFVLKQKVLVDMVNKINSVSGDNIQGGQK